MESLGKALTAVPSGDLQMGNESEHNIAQNPTSTDSHSIQEPMVEDNTSVSEDSITKHIDEEAIKTENLANENNLKLDLPDNLEHTDFSKLLELDSKNDDELFSTTDLLEHAISEDGQKEHTEEVNETAPDFQNGQAAIENSEVASSSQGDKMEVPSPEHADHLALLETPVDVDHTLMPQTGISETLPMPVASSPQESIREDTATGNPSDVAHELLSQDPQEGTPASAIQEKNNISYATRHNSLTPVVFQQHELPQISNGTEHLNSENNADPNNAVFSAVQFQNQQQTTDASEEQSKISAYARLDFQSFTFYVQTLQVIIGRRSENDHSHKVDVNLGPSKSISRRHAQIFYNFGTGRFELSIIGKNGAFVDDTFVERGITVPLKNKTKIQIGQIPFQFVLPEQDNKDKRAINPADAISLKTTLINNNKIAEMSRSTTPQPPSINDTETVLPNVDDEAKAVTKKKLPAKKKEKKPPKPPKPPKKVYTLEEIPPEYRTKPTCSYSNLISTCLRKYSSPKGMSLSEIYAGIRELFPYYKYCPDGWQSSVRHNLSLNKSFRKVSKEGKGWLWGLDEEYVAERERQKKKQAEAAAAKARAAQLKMEQQQQQKAKKQAAVRNAAHIPLVKSNNEKQPNISQTLAANRADRKANVDANQRTMKYLQEQLMALTKDRKGLDKQMMANILTHALAMTINQVTQAAKSKGITGNPLTALIDKNPQHLNLILAAAVNAATVKVTNGKIKQLVSMPPPTVASSGQPAVQVKKENAPVTARSTPQPKPHVISSNSTSATPKAVDSGANGNTSSKSEEPFDPSSLSRFFQPKQPPRVATPVVPPRSVIPQKRLIKDESGSDTSSDEESSSDDDDEADSDSEESGDAGSSTTDDDDDEDEDGDDDDDDGDDGGDGDGAGAGDGAGDGDGDGSSSEEESSEGDSN